MENTKIHDTDIHGADIHGADIEKALTKLKREAEEGGYQLNPDPDFTRELVRGLMINENRYGYRACPCRLASGIKFRDQDLICPCDYRDADLTDYGSCYCALYISDAVAKGTRKLGPIPERRPPGGKPEQPGAGEQTEKDRSLNQGIAFSLPVWRCKVCGYLCARENPPEVCPVCKARERFERFL